MHIIQYIVPIDRCYNPSKNDKSCAESAPLLGATELGCVCLMGEIVDVGSCCEVDEGRMTPWGASEVVLNGLEMATEGELNPNRSSSMTLTLG